MGKNLGKKIAVGLVVGVLATTAIVCAAVPQVRESITDLISKIKGEQTPEEKDNTRKEKTHDDDHYQNLTDDEKKDFDKKLDELVDSDHYKGLDDKGKDELLDKFVESEKVQQEIKNDKPDKKPAEIQTKIEDKQTELEKVQKEIEDLKNSGASEEEIAKAEEKQQQVEEQIKSAEQEKAYWETVETVKESIPTTIFFETQYSNAQVRKINSIYSSGFLVYVNADIIRDEYIDGKIYKSQQNVYITFSVEDIIDYNTIQYSDVLKMIKDTDIISLNTPCLNKNQQSHKDYFWENKNNISQYLTMYEEQGYTLNVEESWETKDSSKPSFLIRADDGTNEVLLQLIYDQSVGRYLTSILHKVCPEFWAQLEIERSQTATTSAEAQAQAEIEEISTRNENGNVTGFDWNAYTDLMKQKEAEKEAKELEQTVTQQESVTYSDQELSL